MFEFLPGIKGCRFTKVIGINNSRFFSLDIGEKVEEQTHPSSSSEGNHSPNEAQRPGAWKQRSCYWLEGDRWTFMGAT